MFPSYFMFPGTESPMLSVRHFPQIPASFLTCWKAPAQALNISLSLSISVFLAIKLRVHSACLVCREAWEILALGVQDILKVQSVIIFMLTTCLTVSSCYNINIRTTYFKIMVKWKLDSFWDPARSRISWKGLWTFKCQDKTQTWSLFISYNKRRLSRMVYAFSQLQSQY